MGLCGKCQLFPQLRRDADCFQQPEILPLHARGKGTAIGISANWLWNFVVVMISPSAIDNLNWQAYLIWMCLNFSFIPLIYFW